MFYLRPHSRLESYNNKELQTELNLNWNDFVARNYDASLGRWMNVDPLAETTMQPYSAFNNNPIYYNDPTGLIAENSTSPPFDGIDQYWDEDGLFFWNSEQNQYEHYTYNDQGQTTFNGYYDTPGGLDQISGEFGIIHNGQGVDIDTSAPNLTVNKDGDFSYGDTVKGSSVGVGSTGWLYKGFFERGKGKQGGGATVAGLSTSVDYTVSGSFFSDDLSVDFISKARTINKANPKVKSSFSIQNSGGSTLDSGTLIDTGILAKTPRRWDGTNIITSTNSPSLLGNVISTGLSNNSTLNVNTVLDNSSALGHGGIGKTHKINIQTPFKR